MEVTDIVDFIKEAYGLAYIGGIFSSEESNLLTLDGINEDGRYYVAANLNDGEVTGCVHWDFSKIKVFIGEEYGGISEMRKQGFSWEEIFIASMKVEG